MLQPCDPVRRWGCHELHSLWNTKRTVRGCWSYSHQLSWQFAFLRCQTGEWCLFLDIIQCNNQIRNEFEALWTGLYSLGQHSPVTELGYVFPSWWCCLLCISLLDLNSGLSSGPVHLLKSCTVGLQQHQVSLCYFLGLCTPPFQLLSSIGAVLLLKALVSTKSIALDLQCETAIPTCPC